ncbi:unnamed protein product [Cochlearia groenlandica]
MHSSMCIELENLVDRIKRIIPDIEDARPGSSGMHTLCLLNKALEESKLLLRYCGESSKLYMAVTRKDILSKGFRAKESLKQNLLDIQSMVPTVLAIKISQILKDLSSSVLAVESSSEEEEEAGKALKELMRRSTSCVSSEEIMRYFHFAAFKLNLSTPESIVTEITSLKSLHSNLGDRKVDKKQVLKYLLCLLKKHERIICRDHYNANSLIALNQTVKDSKMSKCGGYFMPMQTRGSNSETIILTDLSGLTDLPWDAQIKLVDNLKSCFKHNTHQAFRCMSPPSKFLEPLITYLKIAYERNGAAGEGILKDGLGLLLAFLRGNVKAVESLEEDVFKTLSVFLETDVVAEESLNILKFLSTQSLDLSKITASSGTLSSLLKISETRKTDHLQEQAMITLKNLSSNYNICLEMVSLNFIERLTSFLQQNLSGENSIAIMRNLCNTEKGRVCITETPGCLASIAELLDSDDVKEQENAIFILLQLCVQKTEYCYLVMREATDDIYSSLFLISKNGTEEAKMGVSELLRALKGVEESSRPKQEEVTASATSTQFVTLVIHQEPITTSTPSSKKSGLFGISFSSLKKKKRYIFY